MATTMVEPFAPWLRELSQVLHEGTAGAFVPPADLLIDDTEATVYVDVPGLRPQDIDIELENDLLTIRGERPFPYPREAGNDPVRRIERAFGKFERTIRVPRGLDPKAIDASLSEGVLTLHIPRPEQPRPRRIEIKATNGKAEEAAVGG